MIFWMEQKEEMERMGRKGGGGEREVTALENCSLFHSIKAKEHQSHYAVSKQGHIVCNQQREIYLTSRISY